jgi:hypothetical protein
VLAIKPIMAITGASDMKTIYSNGIWTGVYSDFDYLVTDSQGNTVIQNQVDDGECWQIGEIAE